MSEFWFEVETQTTVVADDGKTPIGSLSPGRRYRALGRDDHWVAVNGPGDSTGYAPWSAITVVDDPAPIVGESVAPAATPGRQ